MSSLSTNAALSLETAHRIGARLCRDAIWAGERVNWIGDSMEVVGNQWKVAHRALGPYLYDGTSGIALFLAALHKQSPERIYRRTAEAALRQAFQRLERDAPLIAFYAGHTGVAWVAWQVAEWLDAPEWRQRALALLQPLRGYQPSPEEVDIISGPAGTIPVFLQLAQASGEAWLRHEAIGLGEGLLGRAESSPAGLSWRTVQDGENLTGFSHGSSGIGWALLELAAVTGDARFHQAGEEAFRYERAHFDAAQQNWRDLRSGDTLGFAAPTEMPKDVCGLAWCHGAPGIALARLRGYELTGSPAMAAEARIAVETTARSLTDGAAGAHDSFCLCHGQAGNAEALLLASRILPEPQWLATVEAVVQRGAEAFERRGLLWTCGIHGGAETPSLLLGTAGIGYFYLRAADPAAMPSVLLVGGAG